MVSGNLFTDRGGFNCSAYQHPGRRKFKVVTCSARGHAGTNDKYVEKRLVTCCNNLIKWNAKVIFFANNQATNSLIICYCFRSRPFQPGL